MNFNTHTIIATAAVTILAALICIGMTFMVGRARMKAKIPAPAMTGSPELECALRVHANTVEQIVIFLPALWLAALYFQGWSAPILGAIWCVGRILYAITYTPKTPGKREIGFMLTFLSTVGLVVLTVIGLVQAWGSAA